MRLLSQTDSVPLTITPAYHFGSSALQTTSDDLSDLLLSQIFDYYQECLQKNNKALDYLHNRLLLDDASVIETFNIGFVDRTLGKRIPKGRDLEGASTRALLQKLGILKASGHETFRGTLVIPVIGEHGNIVNAYGYPLWPKSRKATNDLLMQDASIGLFNRTALNEYDDIVLCQNPLDALLLWCAGLRNVVATLGLQTLMEEHIHLLQQSNVKQLYIAFNNDDLIKTIKHHLHHIDVYSLNMPADMSLRDVFSRSSESVTSVLASLMKKSSHHKALH